MCLFSTPSTSSQPAPVPPQEAKMPAAAGANDAAARKRMRQSGGAAAGSLLTGPSGIETSGMNLGATTLLGQ